jgi:serine/threonine protein kinase
MAVEGDLIDFDTLGPITLGRLHNHGANASVFAAESNKYAIKVHHARSLIEGKPDISFTSEVKLPFKGERLCTPLDMCHVFPEGREKSQIALAYIMLNEYIQLGEIFQNMIDYELTFRQNIARELVLAVSELHDSGLLHGDLQPLNIMVKIDTGGVKLIDFEWALPQEHMNNSDDQLGVEDWLAPELLVYGRKALSTCSEVWSVARLLFQLLGSDAKEEFLFVKEKGILEHAKFVGVSNPIYSIEPESDDLMELFSMLHKGVITNQNVRCDLDQIKQLTNFETSFETPIVPSKIDITQTLEPLSLYPNTISIEIIDDCEKLYRCKAGKKRIHKINDDIEIEIDLTNIGKPEIIFSNNRSPIGKGYSISTNNYTWSIEHIGVFT